MTTEQKTSEDAACPLDGVVSRRCSPKAGGYALELCKALQDVVEFHPTKRSKGVYLGSMVNIKTSEELGSMISVHSGDSIGRGRCMNYCPFCGGALRDFSRDG